MLEYEARDTFRRTGRTTRLLGRAVERASAGEHVLFVTYDRNQIRNALELLERHHRILAPRFRDGTGGVRIGIGPGSLTVSAGGLDLPSTHEFAQMVFDHDCEVEFGIPGVPRFTGGGDWNDIQAHRDRCLNDGLRSARIDESWRVHEELRKTALDKHREAIADHMLKHIAAQNGYSNEWNALDEEKADKSEFFFFELDRQRGQEIKLTEEAKKYMFVSDGLYEANARGPWRKVLDHQKSMTPLSREMDCPESLQESERARDLYEPARLPLPLIHPETLEQWQPCGCEAGGLGPCDACKRRQGGALTREKIEACAKLLLEQPSRTFLITNILPQTTLEDAHGVVQRAIGARPTCKDGCEYVGWDVARKQGGPNALLALGWEECPANAAFVKRCPKCLETPKFPWAMALDVHRVWQFMLERERRGQRGFFEIALLEPLTKE